MYIHCITHLWNGMKSLGYKRSKTEGKKYKCFINNNNRTAQTQCFAWTDFTEISDLVIQSKCAKHRQYTMYKQRSTIVSIKTTVRTRIQSNHSTHRIFSIKPKTMHLCSERIVLYRRAQKKKERRNEQNKKPDKTKSETE